MAAMPTLPTQEQLLGRFQALQQRIQAVEAAAELFCRFRAISNRLDAVEQAASQVTQQSCCWQSNAQQPAVHSTTSPPVRAADPWQLHHFKTWLVGRWLH